MNDLIDTVWIDKVGFRWVVQAVRDNRVVLSAPFNCKITVTIKEDSLYKNYKSES